MDAANPPLAEGEFNRTTTLDEYHKALKKTVAAGTSVPKVEPTTAEEAAAHFR